MKQATNNKFKVTGKRQAGQVIIILLMLMLIALSIGLAVTQKSLTDVTTSTQTEQSSRAFSAAEAGIEKALSGQAMTPGAPINLNNDSVARVDSSGLIPTAGPPFLAIQYPPIGRETTAQFWFTDPRQPATVYGGTSFDLYFGNPQSTEKPAIELKIVMLDGAVYKTLTYYYDSDGARSGPSGNGFTHVAGCNLETLSSSILGTNQQFYCRVQNVALVIPSTSTPCTGTCKLILMRARFLYADENQKIAIAPVGNNSFPPQIQIYNATGISGQSEKQLQAFKVIDVVPAWFDFAIFSVNEITK